MSNCRHSRCSFLAFAAGTAYGLATAKETRIPVGLHVYSVRDEFSKDAMGTLREVAKMGK